MNSHRALSAAVAAIQLVANGCFAHAVESNFWMERRKAAGRAASSVASFPLSLPSVENVVARKFPATLKIRESAPPAVRPSWLFALHAGWWDFGFDVTSPQGVFLGVGVPWVPFFMTYGGQQGMFALDSRIGYRHALSDRTSVFGWRSTRAQQQKKPANVSNLFQYLRSKDDEMVLYKSMHSPGEKGLKK